MTPDNRDFKWVSIPPVRDPWWKEASRPLLAFVQESNRTINEILEWGKDHRYTGSVVRHMLAFLSFSDLVYYDPVRRIWLPGAEPPPIEEASVVTEIEEEEMS